MKAKFVLLYDCPQFMLIQDMSEKYGCMSVTNDAENVVNKLYIFYGLPKGKEVYYIDTMGDIDILDHDGKGNFTTFKPGYRSLSDFKKAKGINI